MNKTTKKFVVTLLSVLMVLSFMPTMAFAASTPATGGHSYDDVSFELLDSVPADTEGLKVLVAPTCEDYGAGEITCDVELNGEVCGAVRTVKIDPLDHQVSGDRVRLTADEIMDKMGYDDEDKAYWHLAHPTYCEGYVTLCKECGEPIYKRNSSSTTWRLLKYSRDWTTRVEWTDHTEPATGVTKCDQYFTCTVCGYEYSENDDHNDETEHVALKTEEVYKHATDEKRVQVVKTYCEECGYVEYSDPVAQRWSSRQDAWVDGGDRVTLQDFDHSKTTRVEVIPATCMYQGYYEDVCDECGYVVSSGTIEKKDHTYDTVIYEGDDGYIYSGQYCTYCQAFDVWTQKPGTTDKKIDFVPDDVISLSYTEIAPANCEQGSFVLATYKFNDEEYSVVMSDEDVLADEGIVKVGDKYYDTYIDGEGATKRVEVPFTEALGHDFGQITTFAEATCTEAAIEAKVCSKCGKVDHGTVQHVGQALGHDIQKIEHAATCGDWGYVEETCLRCKEYQNITKTDKPVVAEGVECTFVWTVTKAPTATEDGEEALVCSVCKAVKEGSETVIPKDSDKAKDIAISLALPIIGQAADIMNDTANYKASSIAAIKEAKDILNGAIASGNAADVNRAAEALDALVKAAEKKDANPMTVKAKTVKAKSSKKTTIKKAKAFTVKKAQGKVTFKKASGNKKITVSKAGKVTVKKGLKKGKTYKVKVKVTAAGNGDYLKKTKTVTLKVKVTK